MRLDDNFVTMVRFTNDESRLIHNLRVQKHWGFEKKL